ncbi:Ppx/GppA family phosphatase [Nocardioides sp. dk884]|uniref:Ppx/GppA phosphatase family protein n=1 Tax=Nocardioides sp. dk884 TaxID=2662361 RepID=UPI0012974F8E|nr:Ppx/GppA family phosphatase [Nocardioides sp. dk884]QGA06383.1 Ppx/GppA family phosphatase [Nocardioides sp. dk884]
MRLGVLDIGSNTGHLLVVDAHGGAAPLPASSYKQPLRLAEHLVTEGPPDAPRTVVSPVGTDALAGFTAEALQVAEDQGCEEILAFATSAVRDSANADAVLEEVRARTGVAIEVLSGEDEARLTFLAVRRWFGWSAGRLAVFDIGGGSLEIAGGADEAPEVAWSLPIGAARLARAHFADPTTGAPTAPVEEERLREVRRVVRAEIARAVATSKTFRSLARICGAAPSAEGPLVPRSLPLDALRPWIPKLAAMSLEELAELPGVSSSRAHQVLAGALVAEACMDLFGLTALEICPWALREGVILERLDQLSVLDEA